MSGDTGGRAGLVADGLACSRVEILLAARDDGALAGDLQAAIDRHLDGCDACRAVATTITPPAGGAEPAAVLVVGGYQLGDEVGRGGMGRILAARDLRIGREVAVKELLAPSPAFAARFDREARLTARLQHPGIVPIYEIGAWPDGTPYYAMRMVSGGTLRDAIAAATDITARLALLPAVIAACDAVAFAHGRQVIHRDLTPSNILVGEHGETVVIDWGLAKDLSVDDGAGDASPYRGAGPDGPSELTVAGAVMGTAAYMAPEQAAGQAVDARSDVYALGAILYHLLAGAPPHRGTADEILAMLRAGARPAPLDQRAPGAPRDLVSIVDKAMSRAPADRYPDAGVLVGELRRFTGGRLVEAHAYTSRERVWRWLRRHPVLVASLVTAVVAGTIAVVGVVRERDRAEARRREGQATLATLYAEIGRQRMLEGADFEAAAILAESYRLGNRAPDLRHMLGVAMDAVDAVDYVAERQPDDGVIKTMTFSPDGARLAIGRQGMIDGESQDIVDQHLLSARLPIRSPVPPAESGYLYIAYTADSRQLYVLHGHIGDNTQVLLDGDGEVGRSVQDRVAPRALFHHNAVRDLTSTAYPVDAAPPRADGRRAITCSEARGVEVWDLLDPAHPPPADAAAADMNVERCAPLRDDGSDRYRPMTRIHVYASGRTGSDLVTRSPIRSVALADDSHLLVVVTSRAIEVWDLGLLRRVAELARQTNGGQSAVLDHQRHRLALVRPDGAVIVVALDRLGPRRFVAADHGLGALLGRSDDGELLLYRAERGAVELWGLDGRRRDLPPLEAPGALAFDGGRVAGWTSRGIVVVDTATGRVVRELAMLAGPPRSVILDAGGTRLVAVLTDGLALAFDVTDGRQLAALDGVSALVIDDDSPYLLACLADGSFVRQDLVGGPAVDLSAREGIVEKVNGIVRRTCRSITSLAPDTHLVNEYRIVDHLGKGWHGLLNRVVADPLGALFASSDGPVITLLSTDGQNHDWRTLTVPDVDAVRAFALSPDLARLATEHGIMTIDGRALGGEGLGDDHAVADLRFLRDGRSLVATGADGDVTVWDVRLEDRPPAELVRRTRERMGVWIERGRVYGAGPVDEDIAARAHH